MKYESPSPKQWVMAGIIAGIGAVITYLMSTQIPMPMLISYLFFMAFGPLFCCGIISFYQYLRESNNTVSLKLGSIMLVLAGGINTIMAAMQGALRIYMYELPQADSSVETTKVSWKMALHVGNALQMGVDVAWDFFVLPGLVLFGIGLMNHPQFGKWFGWTAVILGSSGMVFNAWAFPNPPNTTGLIDVGPLVGVWFAVLTIQMIRCYRGLIRES